MCTAPVEWPHTDTIDEDNVVLYWPRDDALIADDDDGTFVTYDDDEIVVEIVRSPQGRMFVFGEFSVSVQL